MSLQDKVEMIINLASNTLGERYQAIVKEFKDQKIGPLDLIFKYNQIQNEKNTKGFKSLTTVLDESKSSKRDRETENSKIGL